MLDSGYPSGPATSDSPETSFNSTEDGASGVVHPSVEDEMPFKTEIPHSDSDHSVSLDAAIEDNMRVAEGMHPISHDHEAAEIREDENGFIGVVQPLREQSQNNDRLLTSAATDRPHEVEGRANDPPIHLATEILSVDEDIVQLDSKQAHVSMPHANNLPHLVEGREYDPHIVMAVDIPGLAEAARHVEAVPGFILGEHWIENMECEIVGFK